MYADKKQQRMPIVWQMEHTDSCVAKQKLYTQPMWNADQLFFPAHNRTDYKLNANEQEPFDCFGFANKDHRRNMIYETHDL